MYKECQHMSESFVPATFGDKGSVCFSMSLYNEKLP